MNKIILMGRLTKDPEVRYSQGAEQMAVARFSLAVDRRWKREGEPEADFFNCTAFGKLAEFVEKYLNKGIKVVVTGRIQNNNYKNKEGQMVYGIQIITEEIEFAESKSAGNRAAASPVASTREVPQASPDGFMMIPEGTEDELPFS